MSAAQILSAYGGGPVGPSDPNFASVLLLLPGAGIAGNPPTDVKLHSLAVTSDVYSTARAKFGLTSILNPSGGFISNANPADRTLYTGTANPITIEAWVYLNSLTTNQAILGQDNGAGLFNRFWIGSGGGLEFDGSNTAGNFRFNVSTPSGIIFAGNWYHVAYVRTGTTSRLYINGIWQGGETVSVSETLGGNSDWFVGKYPGASWPFDGHIAELRISSMARYTGTGTFPVPTGPFETH
jgi:hypothetical protein